MGLMLTQRGAYNIAYTPIYMIVPSRVGLRQVSIGTCETAQHNSAKILPFTERQGQTGKDKCARNIGPQMSQS